MHLPDGLLTDDPVLGEESLGDRAEFRAHARTQLLGQASSSLYTHTGDHCVYTSHRRAGCDLLSMSAVLEFWAVLYGLDVPHLTFLCLQASQLSSSGISSYPGANVETRWSTP
jgi:hypothetical protein